MKYAISMTIEIELKAHVKDFEALRLILQKKAEYRSAFEKEDRYWFPGTKSFSGISPIDVVDFPLLDFPSTGLRIRRENRNFPDGTEGSFTFLTYKIKEVRDGIEINDEREFEIRPSSSNNGTAIEDLLIRLGLKPGISKRKRGWEFLHENINADLAEVENLGWFVELEILADNNREETIAQERRQLLDFLTSLGIGEEAIESRFYSEMLKAKQ